MALAVATLAELFPDPDRGHVFVTDPELVTPLMAERESRGIDGKDEVWDGVLVMSPQANVEHQSSGAELWLVFRTVLRRLGRGVALTDVGVSDREKGWTKNFRVPDVSVFLPTNSARNCSTHMHGGPDLAVEILGHRDPARQKLDFYAKINTREVLVLDRDPWALELYRLNDGKLVLVGLSTPDDPQPLTSAVLPLSFRLVAGESRPTLEVAQVGGEPVWRI